MFNFPERLKSARKMKGWSLQDLADAPGMTVSKQALNKYELGEMNPSGEVLGELSRALGVKQEYFFRQSQVAFGKIDFRKKPSLSAKEEEKIKEQVKEVLERYLEAESFLDIKQSFVNPVKSVPVSGVEDVEEASLKILKQWKLGYNPIPNVIEMLEENGVKVIEIDAHEDFDGLSSWVLKMPVVVLGKKFSVERKRFTALHELGHLILQIEDEGESEKICDAFAGAMLLPDNCLERLLGEKRNNIAPAELAGIKEQFGVSARAIVMRAHAKGIMSDAARNKFFRWISKEHKDSDLGKYEGREKSYRFDLLLLRLVSEEVISFSKAADLAGMTVAKFRDYIDRYR